MLDSLVTCHQAGSLSVWCNKKNNDPDVINRNALIVDVWVTNMIDVEQSKIRYILAYGKHLHDHLKDYII
jgi:hypothetical protein